MGEAGDKVRLYSKVELLDPERHRRPLSIKDNINAKIHTLGEKLDLKFTPPVITISNSIRIYIHKHTS